MKKKTISGIWIVSVIAIAVVLGSSTNVSALSYTAVDGNIWKWSYDELIDKFPELEISIDPANWPNQLDVDIESEKGDPFPNLDGISYLIIKQKNQSYVFDLSDGIPASWDDLAQIGLNGISSYTASVPEPSFMILLSLFLIFLVTIQRKRFIKS